MFACFVILNFGFVGSCYSRVHVILHLLIGLALITMSEALLWTDGRYFLQATQQLRNRWKLMRIGEDPGVETWIADVRSYFFFW